MGELDITYSYIALCGTDGIALCTPRTEFFTEAATSYALKLPVCKLMSDVSIFASR